MRLFSHTIPPIPSGGSSSPGLSALSFSAESVPFVRDHPLFAGWSPVPEHGPPGYTGVVAGDGAPSTSDT
jgi:hypothetical protein